MLKRVRQVWAAMRAQVTPSDVQFISGYLNDSEQEIFWGMGIPDQCHSLRVALDALRLSAGLNDVDRKLLVRCALMHDVGRRKDDVSTRDKIFTVLLHKISPEAAKAWGIEGRGNRTDNLRHALYVYFNHPRRSTQILQTAGVEQRLLDIIAAHHCMARTDDSAELKLLRQADEMN